MKKNEKMTKNLKMFKVKEFLELAYLKQKLAIFLLVDTQFKI